MCIESMRREGPIDPHDGAPSWSRHYLRLHVHSIVGFVSVSKNINILLTFSDKSD